MTRSCRLLLALAALAVTSAAILPSQATGIAGAQGEPYTVTVTPNAELRDGQPVEITVHATPDYPIYGAEARVCRAGVAYQPGTAFRPNNDARIGGPNCPLTPISSSADLSAVDSGMHPESQQPEGRTFTIKVGVGVVAWTADEGPQSLTCDANNPCSLLVQLFGGPGSPTWTPWVQPLSFFNDDPISGCGGAANGIVSSAASDRLTDLWVDLTLAACARAGQSGAATRASFTGEGEAVLGFANGSLDVAYSAGGYSSEVGFLAADAPRRAAVSVPVALNATVLAVGNGRPGGNGKKLPYSDVKLTLDEAAALVSGGSYAIVPYLDAIYARNPELAQTGFFNVNSAVQVAGPSSPDSTSWTLTNHLLTLRPDQWHVPNQGVFGADAGKPRGADAALAIANPSYQNALTLLTGRPALQRNLFGLGATDFGGIWVLTDLATARALGLTPVQLENAAGEFVAPTPDTMAAAVPTMHESDAGSLLPTPSTTSGYPLTFVEYAWAPAYPLFDESCIQRTNSEALLVDWLGYVTGPGQGQLPDGLAPLTADLQTAAATAIPQIGQTPRPDGCDPAAPNGPYEPIPTVPPVPAGGTSGSGGSSGNNASTTGAGRPAAAVSAGVGDSAATIELASSDVPGFFGAGAVGKLLALLAMLLLAGATSVAVVYGSRWSGVTPAEADDEIVATVEEP